MPQAPILNFRRKEDEEQERFPTGAAIGALGLTGVGGALAYGGRRLGQLSDMTFQDVHTALDPNAPVGKGSWASNWLQKRLAPYRPASMPPAPANHVTIIPNAKVRDFQNPALSNVDSTRAAMLAAPDALEAQLNYALGGNQILNAPAYGKYTAFDIMKWLRSPSNKWWRSFLPQLSADWGERALPAGVSPTVGNRGASTEHYTAFAKSPVGGFVHMQMENNEKLNELFGQLGTARSKALAEALSKGGPAAGDVFRKSFVDNLSQWIAPDFNPDMRGGVKADASLPQVAFQLAGATTGIPLSRQKAVATAEKIYSMLESKLPSDQQFANLQKNFKDPQLAPLLRNQEAAVRNVFGAKDQAAVDAMANQLIDKARQIEKKTSDPVKQTQLLRETFKDDPTANLAAAAGYHHINYPAGLTFYRGLAEGLSAPGRAFQAAHKAAPYLTYGGGALAAAGGAYGLYRLLNWYKARQKAKRRQDVLDAAQNAQTAQLSKAAAMLRQRYLALGACA